MSTKIAICFSLVLAFSLLSKDSTAFAPIFSGGRDGGPAATRLLSSSHKTTEPNVEPCPNLIDSNLNLTDDFDFVCHYTEVATQHSGEALGFEALRILAEKCRQRLPYTFANDDSNNCYPGSVVSRFPSLLPRNVTQAFSDQVRELEANGWISTNPDSVDGLPSLHLNLVSHGRPTVERGSSKNDLEQGLEKLLLLVEDPIYNVLLPWVRQLLGTSSIEVSDIFLRRYGQNVCDIARTGISAHYDVFSRVTSVIAMDGVAADGRNGLFTTHVSPIGPGGEAGSTSNHAALRRFFPLQCGDGVVHTWDILHGVDVEPHLDRTSLIVWFTQEDCEGEQTMISPWLLQDSRKDDVADFVLASAISSASESGFDPDVLERELKDYPSEIELYLRSAERGNTFALSQMGSLIEEQALDDSLLRKASRVLDKLCDASSLPEPLRKISQIGGKKESFLAMRFWFEGALRGNPLAQRALADELMVYASESGEEGARILAAVLFGLAGQQGDEEASKALSRVVEFDLASRNVKDEQGFLASPAVQTAKAALS